MKQVFIGDTPDIKIHVWSDVSGYELKILRRDPSGVDRIWNAHQDPGDLGGIVYTCTLEDLDQSGLWVLQGRAELWEDIVTWEPLDPSDPDSPLGAVPTGERRLIERHTSSWVQLRVFPALDHWQEPEVDVQSGLTILRHGHLSGSGI